VTNQILDVRFREKPSKRAKPFPNKEHPDRPRKPKAKKGEEEKGTAPTTKRKINRYRSQPVPFSNISSAGKKESREKGRPHKSKVSHVIRRERGGCERMFWHLSRDSRDGPIRLYKEKKKFLFQCSGET